MTIRIRFGKHGSMKYIGHLDIMRYFQKAMRRAAIPMKFSQGYHPHQIMSFAEPLGLGVTSDGEYMDIETTEPVLTEDGIRRLNQAMVDGMYIYSFRELPDKTPNAMASLRAATYRITYRSGCAPLTCEELVLAMKKFYEDAESIPIVKKTKKSERTLDLKPLIYSWEVIEHPTEDPLWNVDPDDGEMGEIGYRLMLSTGSHDNIKPDLVMEHFHKFLGVNPEAYPIRVYRQDMFTEADGQLVSLDGIGHDITSSE